MRLDKYLAHAGFGTRKEVKQMIRHQRVTVNDCLVRKDDLKIDECQDKVCVDGEPVVYQEFVYYMLNKPQGVVSATMDQKEKTVLECFDILLPEDVFPVGRLDKDTEGLLLITNDGALAHRMLSLKHHVDKKYYVRCEKVITDEMIDCLQRRLDLKDEVFQGGVVEIISDKELYLTIQEGKYHQVKRMVHHAKNEVVYLKRVEFGALTLDESLQVGEYRSLSEEEIKKIGGQL